MKPLAAFRTVVSVLFIGFGHHYVFGQCVAWDTLSIKQMTASVGEELEICADTTGRVGSVKFYLDVPPLGSFNPNIDQLVDVGESDGSICWVGRPRVGCDWGAGPATIWCEIYPADGLPCLPIVDSVQVTVVESGTLSISLIEPDNDLFIHQGESIDFAWTELDSCGATIRFALDPDFLSDEPWTGAPNHIDLQQPVVGRGYGGEASFNTTGIPSGSYVLWASIDNGKEVAFSRSKSVINVSVFTGDSPSHTMPDDRLLDLDPDADGLVLVTHGWWNPLSHVILQQQRHSFLHPFESIARGIRSRLESQHPGEKWQVIVYDWSDRAATFTPWWARARAGSIGDRLGQQIRDRDKKYEHVHLIAHSAGSNLINSIARSIWYDRIVNQNFSTSIHTTFLDPFTDAYFLRYGFYSDWSDCYYTETVSNEWEVLYPRLHDLLLASAGIPVFNSWNVKVDFPYSEQWCMPDSDIYHSYPPEFYLDHLETCPEDWPLAGYTLGWELARENVGLGGEWFVPNDAEYQYNSLSPLVLPGTPSEAIQPRGDSPSTQAFGLRRYSELDPSNLMSQISGSGEVIIGSTGFSLISDEVPDEVVWLTLNITATDQFDSLQMRVSYDEAVDEILLRVYRDGDEVLSSLHSGMEASEKILNVYIPNHFEPGAPLQPGEYQLTFRVDNFSGMASTIQIESISLGLNVTFDSDVNGDGVGDVEDLYEIHRNTIDLDKDGVADDNDINLLHDWIRRYEIESLPRR